MGKIHHIIESQQFDLEFLNEIFYLTEKMGDWVVKDHYGKLSSEEKEKMQEGVKDKKMASLFYEPSTRTRASFEIAMRNLGGQVIFSTENAREFSSAAKGETLEDTIKVLSMYLPDVIVLRYDKAGGTARAAAFSDVPVINAGDGTGQHPTQALLDVYTIRDRLKKIDGLSIAMVGDLVNGRTVRSLSYLLGKYQDINIYYISPDILKISQDIKDYLTRHNVHFSEYDDLIKVADEVDVIYQTRIQKERLGDQAFSYDEVREKCSITDQVLEKLPDHAIIMHPLPRNPKDGELPFAVDKDKRAAYFSQAQNGLFLRMALLKMILAPE